MRPIEPSAELLFRRLRVRDVSKLHCRDIQFDFEMATIKCAVLVAALRDLQNSFCGYSVPCDDRGEMSHLLAFVITIVCVFWILVLLSFFLVCLAQFSAPSHNTQRGCKSHSCAYIRAKSTPQVAYRSEPEQEMLLFSWLGQQSKRDTFSTSHSPS